MLTKCQKAFNILATQNSLNPIGSNTSYRHQKKKKMKKKKKKKRYAAIDVISYSDYIYTGIGVRLFSFNSYCRRVFFSLVSQFFIPSCHLLFFNTAFIRFFRLTCNAVLTVFAI